MRMRRAFEWVMAVYWGLYLTNYYFLHKRKIWPHSSICNFSGFYFLVKKMIFLKSPSSVTEENVNS